MTPIRCAATGSRPSGFTLIELLIVLVIFGITLGLLAVRLLPDDAQLARREAELAALLLERASDTAESTGRPMAWLPSPTRSEFEQPDGDGAWKPLADDPDFRARDLPAALRWSALEFGAGSTAGTATDRAAGAAADASALREASRSGQQEGLAALRLVFLPGEAAPDFSIVLSAGTARLRLRGDALGHVAVAPIP